MEKQIRWEGPQEAAMQSSAAILDEPINSTDFVGQPAATNDTITVAEPTGEEILVEIGASSLCHTDVAIATGQFDETTPLVMGHEGAGYVRDVGEDVESVAVGDSVVLGRIQCGECTYCRQERPNLCTERGRARRRGTLRTGEIRFSRNDEPVHHCHGVSSFTEYTLVTEDVAVGITEELPIEHATLLGCGIVTGAGAVMNTADVDADHSVAVFGCGGVGLSAVQAAAIRGAAPIIAVDLDPEKLELAKTLGATDTVNARKEEDPVSAVTDLADGGVDAAFEVVGDPSVIAQAIDTLGPLGKAVLVGIPRSGHHEVSLDLSRLVTTEQQILGSLNGSYDLKAAIPILAELLVDGEFEADPLITGRRSLPEVNEALDTLESGDGIRQLIIP